MSASKANKQRARAAEIKSEMDEIRALAETHHPFAMAKMRRLEDELRGLRFRGVSA